MEVIVLKNEKKPRKPNEFKQQKLSAPEGVLELHNSPQKPINLDINRVIKMQFEKRQRRADFKEK